MRRLPSRRTRENASGRDRTALADEFQTWPFCSLNDCGLGPCGERASARYPRYHRPNEDKGKKERPSRSVSEGPTFRLPAGLDRAAGSLAMTRVPNVFHGHNRKCERYSRGKTCRHKEAAVIPAISCQQPESRRSSWAEPQPEEPVSELHLHAGYC